MSILFFTIIKVKRIIVIIIIIHSGGTHFVVVHVSVVVVRVVVLGFRIRVVKIAARLPPHHLYLSLETFASMTKLSFPLKKSPK
jgi:dihydroorotase-like cyclic amidohydrolase